MTINKAKWCCIYCDAPNPQSKDTCHACEAPKDVPLEDINRQILFAVRDVQKDVNSIWTTFKTAMIISMIMAIIGSVFMILSMFGLYNVFNSISI
jgi:hypothetical protein